MIVSFMGLKGSGKDTAAQYLLQHDAFTHQTWVKRSFAGALKDVVSAAFGWDRERLEGATPDTRQWREEIDQFWHERIGPLSQPVTPRYMLQYVGTELFRNGLDRNFWVSNLERVIHDDMQQSRHTILTDARFPNEIRLLQQLRAKSFVIIGMVPEWLPGITPVEFQTLMVIHPETVVARARAAGVHPSEWEWMTEIPQLKPRFILNQGTLGDFRRTLERDVIRILLESQPLL